MSNQYLSFDVTKQAVPQELIIGRQGDSQLKFVSILFWDGEKNIPYDLTGKQVVFEALKPDGTHIVDTAGITILNATGGLVRYSFNEQVFAVAGTMQQAFFKITQTDSQNNVITDSTMEINIRVLENRVEFGINSTDYLSEYDKLIADVEKKFDDYAATVQEDITQAQAIHGQIVEYTNLINSNAVITKTVFGDIELIKQPLGTTAVEKLNKEFVQRGLNLKWYGAMGDGKTDDTQAILKAYDDAKTLNSFVVVPEGTYFAKFDTPPDSKVFCGAGVIINDGKRFNVSTNTNHYGDGKLQNSVAFSRYTYGRFNNAAAVSVNANTDDEAAVVGIEDDSSGLSAYDNRDSVALFTTNTSGGWFIKTAATEFGKDYFIVDSSVDLSGVRVGMFVDTNETTKSTGIITGVIGSRVNVNKWVRKGAGDGGVVPVLPASVIINPTTSIWGQNTVVKLDDGTQDVAAVGYELDVINNQPHRSNVDGFNAISDGNYPANAAFNARKNNGGLWNYSLLSEGSEYGVLHSGGSVGVHVKNPKFTGYSAEGTPIVLSSQNGRDALLLHTTDDNGNVLFNMYQDGTMSKLAVQRTLGSGNVSAPVIFATGDIILASPSINANQIIIVTNTSGAGIKINARISYAGLVYNPMTLAAYSSAIFICDGVEYYYTNFANGLSTT